MMLLLLLLLLQLLLLQLLLMIVMMVMPASSGRGVPVRGTRNDRRPSVDRWRFSGFSNRGRGTDRTVEE